jgi:hypothetical protein
MTSNAKVTSLLTGDSTSVVPTPLKVGGLLEAFRVAMPDLPFRRSGFNCYSA